MLPLRLYMYQSVIFLSWWAGNQFNCPGYQCALCLFLGVRIFQRIISQPIPMPSAHAATQAGYQRVPFLSWCAGMHAFVVYLMLPLRLDRFLVPFLFYASRKAAGLAIQRPHKTNTLRCKCSCMCTHVYQHVKEYYPNNERISF